MAELTVHLEHGLTVGKDVLKEVVLREVRAGDIIEAHEEAEKLVYTNEGPQLLASPTLVGVHVLRRQIVRIGDVKGPISLAELKRLDPADLNKLQAAADSMESAMDAEATAAAVTNRGREDRVGRAD